MGLPLREKTSGSSTTSFVTAFLPPLLPFFTPPFASFFASPLLPPLALPLPPRYDCCCCGEACGETCGKACDKSSFDESSDEVSCGGCFQANGEASVNGLDMEGVTVFFLTGLLPLLGDSKKSGLTRILLNSYVNSLTANSFSRSYTTSRVIIRASPQ